MNDEDKRDTIPDLASEIERLQQELADERAAKDAAYAERDKLVALSARLSMAVGWRSGTGEHEGKDDGWDPSWRGVAYIETPAGQMSWHYHDREAYLFKGLPVYGRPWDGHTADEKYARLERVLRELDAVHARMARMAGFRL